jgi:hypothetical protein
MTVLADGDVGKTNSDGRSKRLSSCYKSIPETKKRQVELKEK